MSPLRVLYLIDSVVASGGAEQAVAALAPGYVERGVRLDVGYLLDRAGLQANLEAAGARTFCLAGPGGRLGWLVRTRRLIRDRRPDLVHTTLFEADVAGRLAAAATRTLVVSSLVNVPYGPEHTGDPSLSPWKVRAAQAADAATARLVRRFHAITDHVARTMARRLLIPPERIDVVPRGRDPQALGVRDASRRRRVRSALGLAHDELLFLAVGRHEHQKGFDVLLQAFARLLSQEPRARLLIAGRMGNATPVLQALAGELRLTPRVELLGPRADVPDLLCAADAFVMSSRWEGLGSVLLEAMALEAPIVATDLPAVREVVGGAEELARLAKPGDPEALAEAMLATIADGGAGRLRVVAARDRFLRKFTVDAVADSMLAFYERALGRLGARDERSRL